MRVVSRWQEHFPDASIADATLLIDGQEYFDALAKAIETARSPGHFIYVLGWMIDVDLPMKGKKGTTSLGAMLEEAARRGVRIKILIWRNPIYFEKHSKAMLWALRVAHRGIELIFDHWTGATKPTRRLLRAVEAEIEGAEKFANPPRIVRPTLTQSLAQVHLTSGDPSPVDIRKWLGQVSHRIGSHHEKTIVVRGNKGLIGFCGGMDLNKNRLVPNRYAPIPFGKKSAPKYFHDVAVELRGDPARSLLSKVFARLNNIPGRKKDRRLIDSSAVHVPYVPKTVDTHVQVVGTFNSIDGNDKDRSFADAYLTVIRNALRFIYIEDQYLVNEAVADEINKRIRDPDFELAMFVVQDSDETGDIAIPNRKRRAFLDAATRGASQSERDKILYAVVKKDDVDALGADAIQNRKRHHTGMHAKVLIVDDEIAIIGSGNVNRRSFTLDSETSAVIFGGSFARDLRILLWEHTLMPDRYVRGKTGERSPFGDLKTFPNSIRTSPTVRRSETVLYDSYLVEYTTPNKRDIDVRTAEWIKDNSFKSWALQLKSVKDLMTEVWTLGGQPNVPLSRVVDDPDRHAPRILDIAWDTIIDPDFDA